MKDELGRKTMRNIVGLKANSHGYLIDDGSEDRKAKVTKKCVKKRNLKFENYKNCLEATQIEKKIVIQKKIKLAQIVLKKS